MTRFYRLSGGGNDFLALVEPAGRPTPDQVRAWCRRGLSAGADGVFALEKTTAGARMTYWNADGTEAALCLNGTRCAARLAVEMGWIGLASGATSEPDRARPGGEGGTSGADGRKTREAPSKESFTIETGAGQMAARAVGRDRFEVELPRDLGSAPERLELVVDGQAWPGHAIAVGVPHFVLEWPESLAGAPVERLGRVLRSHPDLAPAGANVHFVRYPRRDRLEIRSYERGVEAETLACGTGALAAAAVGVALRRLELPAEALTLGGFLFEIGGVVESSGRIARWTLTGDARLVARGELLADAESLPSPPSWS